jgi:hypothetical protein
MFDDNERFESDFDELEMGDFEEQYEFQDEREDEYEFEDEYEAEYFEGTESEEVFDELEEMELASELLTVSDDREMEQFIGDLIKKAGRKIGRFAKSSTGRALGGILKKTAKVALPMLGSAAGTFLGGPVGGMIGGKLASAAGRTFGLELEGLSPEDKEFEVARRFVRFAGDAARKAAQTAKSVPARKAAIAAVKSAAGKHAPGLLTPGTTTSPSVYKRPGGRWIRRGSKIILLGV